MLGVNQTWFLVQHGLTECKCDWQNENVHNSKQKWNCNEGWSECKELDDSSFCQDYYIWNPSASNYKCNKTYKNWIFRFQKLLIWKMPTKLILACEDEIFNEN